MEKLQQQLKECRENLAAAKKQEKEILEKIWDAIKEDVTEQLKDKPYGAGTARLGDFKVEIRKNVSWEQNGLKDVAKNLIEEGKNPAEYIDAKYSVSESKYKAWPEEIRAMFREYREVKTSAPTIKIEG